jgi:hypothetical protein
MLSQYWPKWPKNRRINLSHKTQAQASWRLCFLSLDKLWYFGCERGILVTTCRESKSKDSRLILNVMSHDIICRCGFARDISRVHLAAPLQLAPGKPLTDVTLPLSSLTCNSLCRNSNTATLPTATVAHSFANKIFCELWLRKTKATQNTLTTIPVVS